MLLIGERRTRKGDCIDGPTGRQDDRRLWRVEGSDLVGGFAVLWDGTQLAFPPFFAVPLGGPLLQASNRGLIVRSEETEAKPGIVYSLEKTT